MSAPSRKEDEVESLEESICKQYAKWCQKKRPADPELRAELLREARACRDYSTYARDDGQPLAHEDRRNIRHVNLEIHRERREVFRRFEDECEARFWRLLAKYGIHPEGGVQ